ncbi:MAG: ABC transporter permease [Blautia sp.]|jgi:putative ABC transport system permease protein
MSGFIEYVKMAIQNILANKGRSFLTMLGIIIGIASVIAIVSIGEGTKNQMNSEIDGIGGVGQIAVYCSDDAMAEEEWLTVEDAEALRELDDVEGVTMGDSYNGETVTGKGDFTLMVSSDTADAKDMNNIQMKRGNFFTRGDEEAGRNVCVLSDTDAKRLFGSDDVVGMDLDVTLYDMTKSFQIVGVSTQKENGTFVSYTYEGMPVNITVPYTAMADFVGGVSNFYSLTVKGSREKSAKEVTDEVIHLLENRHQSAGEDYYQVQSFQDQMKMLNDMLSMVTAFISFVAGISLLVGGIGVMNIMLVSVTERTREIGIRKSLGAKTSSIMLQFLAESAILTVIGGIIGIILGILGAYGLCSIISGTQGMTISPGISLSTVLTATLFSCAVGVFFGIYPAKKAAKLSPIEALRRN